MIVTRTYSYRGYTLDYVGIDVYVYDAQGNLVCRCNTEKDAKESIDYWIDGSSR